MHYWNDYGDHHDRWMRWVIALPLGVLFWVCVVWGLVALARTVSSGGSAPRSGLVPGAPRQQNPAKAILDERFARGEIDDDEYRRRLDALKSS